TNCFPLSVPPTASQSEEKTRSIRLSAAGKSSPLTIQMTPLSEEALGHTSWKSTSGESAWHWPPAPHGPASACHSPASAVHHRKRTADSQQQLPPIDPSMPSARRRSVFSAKSKPGV